MYTIINTDSFRFSLGQAVATNELTFSATYAEVVVADGTWNGLSTVTGNSNGTSLVNLIPAPAATERRDIKTYSIHNTDTIDHMVTVQLKGVDIYSILLRSGYTLLYRDGSMRVINARGSEDVVTIPLTKANDRLVPTGTNTIPNLSTAPAVPADVQFYINGLLDYEGYITSTGLGVISVNPAITAGYGFDIDTSDVITAIYDTNL